MCVYKMENSYETWRMPELKALARERRLRGYSPLRKAELTLIYMGYFNYLFYMGGQKSPPV